MSKCELCGEPMPVGEEMFKYHGLSGPCPKPPLPRALEHFVRYRFENRDDRFWLVVIVDGAPLDRIAFDTGEERQRAYDDMLNMLRRSGAKDLPSAAAH